MANPQSTVDTHAPETLSLRRVSYRPDLDVVLATGDLDQHTAPLLARELAGPRPQVLVCDLSGVYSLDASGLTVLLDAADSARAQHRRFGVVTPIETPLGLNRPSGAAARLDAFSSLSDAIRELPSL